MNAWYPQWIVGRGNSKGPPLTGFDLPHHVVRVCSIPFLATDALSYHDTGMKVKAGDIIECASCQNQVGTVVRDIPDDTFVRAEDIRMTTTQYSDKGPLCDRCRGTAAFHDDQSIGWVIQVKGRRVS